MLKQGPSIDHLREAFSWEIPTYFNIGVDICDRPASLYPDRTAIIDAAQNAPERRITFDQMRAQSNQLAQGLMGHCQTGDRVGVLLPQCIETALSHVAISKIGAIALPLFTQFGPDALGHRLADSGARVVITDANGLSKIDGIKDQLPALETVICIGAPQEKALHFDTLLSAHGPDFTPASTRAEDPALLIYTSGTTGNPKGALHAHRVLLGHLPGVEMSHDFLPQDGDCIWTPADWAWIGGLLDVLMPALHHGVPVVACRFEKFTAQAAFSLMDKYQVRNAFLPPTALKMMRIAPESDDWRLKLRSVASGGEPLGKEMQDWGQKVLGATINEFYGQTECNMIVSSCAVLAPAEPGIMGYSVPGHRVEILDENTGQILGADIEGDIAVLAPNPVMFLRYWQNPEATEAKFRHIDGQKWLITGDRGKRTKSGRLAFVGRDDDVISSAGYRIGPTEIEDCLITHPAVAMAGVIGAPDAVKGHVVAAYVQLVDGTKPNDQLAQDISDHVRARLAAYEAPRYVRFVDQMPLTTTGKIIRGRLRDMAEADTD